MCVDSIFGILYYAVELMCAGWLIFGILRSLRNKASLRCLYVLTCVRMHGSPSTKSFFDFNEIWRVGRGRRVMHDGMQYDPIQGQGQEPLKVGNPSIVKSCLLCHLQWELATDH